MATFSEVIDKLVRKRAQLLAELAKVDEAIDALSSLSGLFDEREESAVADAYAEHAAQPQPEPQRERSLLPPDEIARFAREVLVKRGRPMKRGVLVQALEARGVPMVGKDKAKNLGTILWRHNDEFINLEKFGYWPRDIPIKDIFDPQNPPDGIMSPRLRGAS